MLQTLAIFFSAMLLVSGTAHAQEKGRNTDSSPQEFLEIYEKVKKGKSVPISGFKDHVLYPYLEYEKIRSRLSKTSDDVLKRFIDTYPDTHLAEKLWVRWLSRLASRKQWKTILTLYSEDADSRAASCIHFRARIYAEKEEDKTQLKEDAVKFWMTDRSLPNECKALTRLMIERQFISKKEIWQRIDLAIQKGRTKLVRGLGDLLENDEEKLADLLAYSHRRPTKALKSKSLGKGVYSRRVVMNSIKRIARKNRKKGRKKWKQVKNKYPFNKEEIARIEAYLATKDAISHDKRALRAFAKIPSEYRDDDANIWMARIALRQGNWKKLLNAINAMTPEQAQRDIWRYWRARAYTRTGKPKEANRIFKTLAEDASFYGFLSADRLDLPYGVFETEKYTNDRSQCIERVKQLPSVQRALAWFELDKTSNAKKEWYWTVNHLNKEGQLTLAALALQMKEPLLAVSTVSKTKDWNQVRLRFPMLYQKLVREMAKENNVTPAWVYGIMRRESVFNNKAVSSAKAMGLMQLLPSTARHVARKLGFKVAKSDLLTPEVNVKLGSAYLSQMLAAHKGSYIQATAAYNAGPGRVRKWRPSTTIDADRWVESIPFTETRKYVRAVMSYTTIYDHQLTEGKGKRISYRIKPIDAR